MDVKQTDYDIAIAGRGHLAQLAALAFTHMGFSVCLIGKTPAPIVPPAPTWQFVLALSSHARFMLERLHIWPALMHGTSHIQTMDIYNAPARFGRFGGGHLALAPEGEQPLAHIVSHADLSQAIHKTIQTAAINSHPTEILTLEQEPGHVRLLCAGDTQITARLCIDAQGKSSLRMAQKIRMHNYDYGQNAVICAVQHENSHSNRATQIFTPHGPLALLPLPTSPHESALVWSQSTPRARALLKADAPIFTHELMQYLAGRYGAVTSIGVRAMRDLSAQLAQDYVKGRYVLLGDAAHIFHPMAGQGFNLGLRDIALLSDCVSRARAVGLDLAAPSMLEDYHYMRRADARLMADMVRGLHIIFSRSPRLGQAIGGLGLSFVQALKAHVTFMPALVRHADYGLGDIPPLMRAHEER